MDFERQKPVSDEYRENWERAYGIAVYRNGKNLGTFTSPADAFSAYENGCPILTEEKEANG